MPQMEIPDDDGISGGPLYQYKMGEGALSHLADGERVRAPQPS
jgi:hypothetical protein